MRVRHASEADAALLAPHGLGSGNGAVIVLEREGAVIAGLSVAPRPFESEILGQRIAHIETIATWEKNVSIVALIEGSLDLLASEGYRFVSTRHNETNRRILAALQTVGFRVIECLLTLDRPFDVGTPTMPTNVRIAEKADVEGCAAIAGHTFRFDRFHADPEIDDDLADKLKVQWARNSVLGRADVVFVTYDQEKITGFNACLVCNDSVIIDLIGVAPEQQGRGLGRALTTAALAHYAGKATRMLVGTQSCNVASLALYQSMGFRIAASALTLHAHLP